MRLRKIMPVFLTVCLLKLFAVAGYVWLHKDVYLHLPQGRAVRSSSYGKTVQDALNANGQELKRSQRGKLVQTARLRDGIRIQIIDPIPVTLKYDGKEVNLTTYADNVGEVIDCAGIKMDSNDIISSMPKQRIYPGMQIHVFRVEHRYRQVAAAYPYKKIQVSDDRLEKGLTRVISQGKEGLKNIKIQQTYVDGRYMGEAAVAEKIIRRSDARVVAVGQLGMISRGGNQIHFQKVMEVEATAYDSSGGNGGRYYGLTAVGTRAKKGVVAVDPKVIPLHTRLYIEGYGYAVAEDTGGAIKGHRIDLCFNSNREAIQFGRKKIKIYVLD